MTSFVQMRLLGVLDQRQFDIKSGSLAKHRLGSDLSIVGLDDLSADIQTKACTSGNRAAIRDTKKTLEEFFQVLRRDTRARIANRYDRQLVLLIQCDGYR